MSELIEDIEVEEVKFTWQLPELELVCGEDFERRRSPKLSQQINSLVQCVVKRWTSRLRSEAIQPNSITSSLTLEVDKTLTRTLS